MNALCSDMYVVYIHYTYKVFVSLFVEFFRAQAMLSYVKMTALSIGSQDQLDGMVIYMFAQTIARYEQ